MNREPGRGQDPMRDQDDELIPDTEPSGRLDPPRRPPPTAVGAGTPNEDKPDRRPAELYDRARLRARSGRTASLPVRFAEMLIGGLRRVIRKSRQKIQR